MGIDGIGKRGGIPTPDTTGASSTSSAQKTGQSFAAELQKPSAAATEAVRGSSALEDFKAGRIDMNGYLDQKVDAATAHLQGLPPADLEQLRSMLRDQLASDPGLAELVQKATGQSPVPEGE